jgi:hypothetical protein
MSYRLKSLKSYFGVSDKCWEVETMRICNATRVFALGVALAITGVAVTSASAEEQKKEGGAVKGAAKGAAIGAVVPGVSAKTGAAVGAVSGGIKKSKQKNEDK